MNPLLALAYAACVLERRWCEGQARRPGVSRLSPPPQEGPRSATSSACVAQKRGRAVSPQAEGLCAVPPSSCLLPQSQWLSHLDHFLDYVAQEVRKGGERKTNKMKLFSMHSLSGGRTDVRGPRSGCITQGKANARGLILRRKIRGTFMPPNGH